MTIYFVDEGKAFCQTFFLNMRVEFELESGSVALQLRGSLTVDTGSAAPGQEAVSNLGPTYPVLLPGGSPKKHRRQAGQDTTCTFIHVYF